MKLLKTVFFSALLAYGLTTAVSQEGSAQEPVIVTLVQDADYPPFMTISGSTPAGIYANIIREADRRLEGYEIRLTAAPWPRAKYLVQTGRVNGLVGTYHRPAARPWIGTFSVPMAVEDVHVYCRSGVATPEMSYPEDYVGLLFSNNPGFNTPGDKFFEMVRRGELFLVELATTEENLRLIEIGRADCYVQDKTAVDGVLKQSDFKHIVDVRQVSYEPAHIGYSDKWDPTLSEDFIVKMDAVLKEMHDDGTIARVIAFSLRSS